jgi:uncharacterized protein YndB with AHSA1/START domain
MHRTIRFNRYFPYPVSKVWNALTNAQLLGEWFMENDFEPTLNHEFTFRKEPQPGWNGITYCKVIEVNSFRSIAYTYCGTAGGEKALACAGIHSDLADATVKGMFTELDTILRFTIEPKDSGTYLKLEHSGFKGFKLVIISFIMGWGWKKLLRKLETLLQQTDKQEIVL